MTKKSKEPNSKVVPTETNEERRRKLELIHNGFVVFIGGVDEFKEGDNYLSLKIRLLSDVQGSGAFGDVELKFSRQVLQRLKSEINKAV